jgi:hypothetical protein
MASGQTIAATMTNQQYLQKHYSLSNYSWRVLRDCEKALHKWAEDECNGRIQWDDETGEPHLYRKDKFGDYTGKGQPTFNKEDHYLDLARKQAARYGLQIFHQTDPRGCALYVYTKEDLERSRFGSNPKFGISAVYNTVATAIC